MQSVGTIVQTRINNIQYPQGAASAVLLIVALIIFGPQRLAGIGGAVGKAIREFRTAVRDVESDIDKPAISHRTPERITRDILKQ